MDVEIVELQEQPTAVIREQVAMNALPEFFGSAFAAVNAVQAGTLPACRAVQAMHVGGYDTLDTTYEAVKQRMHEEGMKASDDMWEYYLSDQSTDPATWRTLVIWPVL